MKAGFDGSALDLADAYQYLANAGVQSSVLKLKVIQLPDVKPVKKQPKRPSGGRPPKHDPAADAKLAEAWAEKRELGWKQSDAAEELDVTQDELQKAIDRDRNRNRRHKATRRNPPA